MRIKGEKENEQVKQCGASETKKRAICAQSERMTVIRAHFAQVLGEMRTLTTASFFRPCSPRERYSNKEIIQKRDFNLLIHVLLYINKVKKIAFTPFFFFLASYQKKKKALTNAFINQHNPDGALPLFQFWLNFRIGPPPPYPPPHTQEISAPIYHKRSAEMSDPALCITDTGEALLIRLHVHLRSANFTSNFPHSYWETLTWLWEISAALGGLNRDTRPTETAAGEQTARFMSSSCTLL